MISAYLYLFCFSLLVLNLFVRHINAADHEDVGNTAPPTDNKTQALILGTTSTETFSFEDVDRIELNLEASGDIEVIATENDVITVTLEKQMQATNTDQNALMRAYLDNITLTGVQNENTLQLKAQLPTKQQPFSNIGELYADLYKHLQLKWTIKTPADVSVKLQIQAGHARLQGIRGEIDITTRTGDVHLNETLGSYNIALTKGSIDGEILLTQGQNTLKTQNGSIGLKILDTVAAPMDIYGTTRGASVYSCLKIILPMWNLKARRSRLSSTYLQKWRTIRR